MSNDNISGIQASFKLIAVAIQVRQQQDELKARLYALRDEGIVTDEEGETIYSVAQDSYTDIVVAMRAIAMTKVQSECMCPSCVERRGRAAPSGTADIVNINAATTSEIRSEIEAATKASTSTETSTTTGNECNDH